MRAMVKAAVSERDFGVCPTYVDSVLATGAKKRVTSRWFNALSVEATKEQIDAIARMPFVRDIEPVRKTRRDKEIALPATAPKTPPPTTRAANGIGYGRSYYQLEQINVIAAHEAGYDGTGVVVGIMDTGFYKGHETLTSRTVLGEWDVVFDDNDVEWDVSNPDDFSDGHGTSVWSALGGFKDGQLVGAAFNASFLLVKAENSRLVTAVEEDYWVAGIEWLEANGADVVNSSLGYKHFDDADSYVYADLDGNTAKATIAADIAVSLGVVVCNAAGNNGPSAGTLLVPSDAHRILSCGALTPDGDIAFFSARGPTYDGRIKPEVAARGLGVWLALNTRTQPGYDWRSGTSFASPLVAGAVALILQAHPDWTPAQVREALLMTASCSQSPNNAFGWGIVDTMAAIEYVPSPTAAGHWQRYH